MGLEPITVKTNAFTEHHPYQWDLSALKYFYVNFIKLIIFIRKDYPDHESNIVLRIFSSAL